MRTVLLGLALLSSAGPALAQAAPQTPPPAPARGGMMMRADTDGDGAISRAEYIAQATARFDRMDTNHDGKLTPDEIGARRGARFGGGDMPPPPPVGAPPRQ